MKEVTRPRQPVPNPALTEIVAILDRSGSMGMDDKQARAIEGFNSFLAAQQALPGQSLMTVILFDDQYEVLHAGVPVKDVPLLTDVVFVPRGNTRLFDAMGRTIHETKARHAGLPIEERPARTLVAVLTDGGENNSQEFKDKTKLKELIDSQRTDSNWEFLYLSADPDAFSDAASIGINPNLTFGISNTGSGFSSGYRGMTMAAASYTNTGTVDMDAVAEAIDRINMLDSTGNSTH